MTLQPWQFVFLLFAGWVNRQQLEVIDYLRTENRVLREQLGGKRLRFTADQRRQLAAKGKRLGRKVLAEVCGLVSPDTILRWYRELIAKKYDGSKARAPGRPRTARWGYTRIRGALENLGHTIGRNTIKRILAKHGIEPVPERGRRTPWSTFLKAHLGAIAGCDFFTVEALTLTGLARFHVFFVIDLKTRRVEIGGIVRQPDGGWLKQVARNLVDSVDGFLGGFRYLIHDRDPLFTAEFRRILGSSGVNTVKLPARSPNLNAYAERFVLSDQIGVPQPHRTPWRAAPPQSGQRVRGALSSGTQPSRNRQPAHHTSRRLSER